MKNYHISFSYWNFMPGVIVLPGNTPDEAIEVLKTMAKDLRDVEIVQVVEMVEEGEPIKEEKKDGLLVVPSTVTTQ